MVSSDLGMWSAILQKHFFGSVSHTCVEAFEVDEVQGLKLYGFAVLGTSNGGENCLSLLVVPFQLGGGAFSSFVTPIQRAVVAVGRRFFQAGILPYQCEMTRLTKRYMIE